MQRGDIDVRHVHRHLRNAVFLYIPAYRLRLGQRAGDALAASFAHFAGDVVGSLCRLSFEVPVHGNQEVAGTHHRTARAGNALVEGTRPIVGLQVGIGQFLGQSLVLASTAIGQVAEGRTQGRSLVAIAGNACLTRQTLGQPPSQLRTLLKRNAADGHQRQHVGGPDARVFAVLTAHVYQLASLLRGPIGRLHHRLWFAGKGHYGAVGRLSGVYVQQFHAAYRLNLVGNLAYDCHVAALAEVGHALYNCLLSHLLALLFVVAKLRIPHEMAKHSTECLAISE